MRLHLYIEATSLSIASLAACFSLAACSSGPNMTPKLRDALTAEQTANHVVIGYVEQYSLEYIDLTAGSAFKRDFVPVHPSSGRTMDVRDVNGTRESPDGKWTASCTDAVACQISETSDPSRRFSLPRDRVLTAIKWAPDERLAFVVEKAPNWRFPPRCSFDDEWDVVVYDFSRGASGILTTVCGGFPYESLGWYELSPK